MLNFVLTISVKAMIVKMISSSEQVKNSIDKVGGRLEAIRMYASNLSEEKRAEIQEQLDECENNAESEIEKSEEMLSQHKAGIELLKEDLKDIRTNSTMGNSNIVSPIRMRTPTVGGDEPAQTRRMQVKLPKLELMKFTGDVFSWTTFWETFRDSIDQAENLSEAQKFQYLLASLQGEAKNAISCLPPTASNYAEAIKILKNRYGSDSTVKIVCHKTIEDLPAVPRNDTSRLREFYDKMESCFRSLKTLGEDINNSIFKSLINRKLPFDVQNELYDMEAMADKEWDMEQFRIALGKLVKKKEILKYVTNPTKQANEATGMKAQQYENRKMFHRSTAESLAINEHKAPKYPCVYCNESHWPSDCHKFQTAEERIKKLGKRCFICLRENHLKQDCKSSKMCRFCNLIGKHHQSLCFKKFGSNNYKQSTKERSAKEKMMSIVEDKNVKQNDSNQALLAAGQAVLMQTAIAKVENGKNFCKTRLFFDSGSSRTWCSEELAKTLNLKRGKKEKIQVSTFGKNPSHIESTRSKLTIDLLDGSMTIDVNIVSYLVDSLFRVPVTIKEAEIINEYFPLADTVITKEERVPVHLLIGNDYYSELIIGKREVLKDGLFLLSSRLGWIISGRTNQLNGEDSIIGCSFESPNDTLTASSIGDLQLSSIKSDVDV